MTDNLALFARAELTMICSLFYALVFQKLITWRLIPIKIARIVQHMIQGTWFLGICAWIMVVELQWTQAMTFTLHTIAMLMKQHSYNSYNIDLHFKKSRFQSLKIRDDLSQEEQEELNDLNHELCAGGVLFPGNQTITNFIVSFTK
jgi:sterol O-acyltransferase